MTRVAVWFQLGVYAWILAGVLGSMLRDHPGDLGRSSGEIMKRSLKETLAGPLTLIKARKREP